MSLRIVPLPIEQAKVPVFRVVCSRAPKALASQDTWVLRGAACRRVVRFWNTAWHHYAPTEPHAETSSIRTRPGLRNKMVFACEHARLCISTWTRSTRSWSSATTLSCGESPSLSPGAGTARSSALPPTKSVSSACSRHAERLCPNANFEPPDTRIGSPFFLDIP